jgi:delta 1-pyrroline-5-carboxylate dehydrogenase
VQPFGGEGLSGTGPKAGGPLYLLRLLAQAPAGAARAAVEAAGAPADKPLRGWAADGADAESAAALQALQRWAGAQGLPELAQACEQQARCSPMPTSTASLKRIGQPHEIAGAAVFLASQAGAFMTGQTMVIDGGVTSSGGGVG